MRELVFGALILAGVALPGASAIAAGGVVEEVRLGLLYPEVHFPGGRENGVDINGEVLFASPVPEGWGSDLPSWLRWLARPRPDLGASINTSGYTSQGYLGVTWTAPLFDRLVGDRDGLSLGFSLGPSFNDGHINTDLGSKSIGSNVLLRGSVELDYQVTSRLSVGVMYDYSSTAGLASRNGGLSDLGVRLGLKF
jgi:lipid A 3-O-deacylase